MKTQYRHKRTNSLLQLKKEYENFIMCYVLNEDGAHEMSNYFSSKKQYKKVALCKKDNLISVTCKREKLNSGIETINLATMFTGGLSAIEFALKYENIEYKHIFGAEWDKYARKQCIEFHGEPEEFYHDVSKFDGSKYKNKIDLLVWGSSCQNFSLAGNRKGLDGDASKYFIDGLERQKEIMPKTFIFENVKGMLSANNGNDFKYALQAFRDMGYFISYKVLNAKDYGTAQNRERVFIVGFLNEDEYHAFCFEEKKPLEKCLNDYLDDEVDEKYFLSEKMLACFKKHKERHQNRGNGFAFSQKLSSEIKYINCLSTKYGNRSTDTYLRQIGSIGNGGQGNRVYSTDGISCTLSANGGGLGAKTGLYFVPRGNNHGGFKKTNILPTITTSSFENNCFIGGIRKITPRECFRLMGVKDEDIKLVNSDTQSYKIAGNGIEVNTIRSIVRALYKNEKQNNLFDFIWVA